MSLAINALPRFNEANGNLGLQPWLQPSPSKPGRPLSKSQYPYKAFSRFGKERMPVPGRIWPDRGPGAESSGGRRDGAAGAQAPRFGQWRGDLGGRGEAHEGSAGAAEWADQRKAGRGLALGVGAGESAVAHCGPGPRGRWRRCGFSEGRARALRRQRRLVDPSPHGGNGLPRRVGRSCPGARKKARPRKGAGRGADGSVREAPTSGGRARRGGGLR